METPTPQQVRAVAAFRMAHERATRSAAVAENDWQVRGRALLRALEAGVLQTELGDAIGVTRAAIAQAAATARRHTNGEPA